MRKAYLVLFSSYISDAAPCSCAAEPRSLVVRLAERRDGPSLARICCRRLKRRVANDSPSSTSSSSLAAIRGWSTADVFAQVVQQLLADNGTIMACDARRHVRSCATKSCFAFRRRIGKRRQCDVRREARVAAAARRRYASTCRAHAAARRTRCERGSLRLIARCLSASLTKYLRDRRERSAAARSSWRSWCEWRIVTSSCATGVAARDSFASICCNAPMRCALNAITRVTHHIEREHHIARIIVDITFSGGDRSRSGAMHRRWRCRWQH